MPGQIEATTVETDQGRFTADVAGPTGADLVVLLHGFPQTRHTWRHELIPLAEAGYRALAPDQRGYSPGVRPPGIDAYRTERLVRDVLDLADALSAPRFHLVGHDWGGQVAWLTAAHHPDRVVSLSVLSRPHPAAFARSFALDPDQAERSKHHRAFDDPSTVDRLLADDARRLRGLLANASVPAADIDAYLSVIGDAGALEAALNWYRAASAASGSGGGLRAPDTPPVVVPTLYLWGDHDQSVGRSAATLTADHVTGPYRFVELAGGGHFLTDDSSAAQVTQEIVRHVRDHDRGTGQR